MKITLSTQTPLEFIGKKANLVPVPLAHTHIFSYLARAIYEAVFFGIFDSLKDSPATIEQIASTCHLNAHALSSLMAPLTSQGYFREKQGSFSLTPMSRKWLLADSPHSLRDQLLFLRDIWHWLDLLPEFLRTGRGLDHHAHFDARQWTLYQAAMRTMASQNAAEAVKKIPLPPHPELMMDVGGAHGLYPIALCHKHPGLRARILELPEAVEIVKPIFDQMNSGDRITYVAADALTFDFGENLYDLVLISNLLHHFTAEQNKALCIKIARALKPGGYFVIQEFIRPRIHSGSDIIGSTLALFFNLSSNGGTWSREELAGWQLNAGLKPYRIKSMLSLPGFAQIMAKKN